MQGPPENVLAAGIGSKDVDTTFIDPEQVRGEGYAGYPEVQRLARQIDIKLEVGILPPVDEKIDVTPLLGINLRHPAEIGLDRPGPLQSVQEGARRTAIMVAEHRDLRRPVLVVLVPPGDGRVIRRQEGCNKAHPDQHQQHKARHHRRPVLFEPRPDQLGLTGGEIGLLLTLFGRGVRGHGLVRHRLASHHAAPDPRV